MARFDRAIATAERLIKRNGQSVIWRIPGEAAGANPWEPEIAPDTNHDVVICFLPPDKESRVFFAFLRGQTQIPMGYIQGLMKGNIDFDPKLSHVVVRDGTILKIRSVDLLSPNGQKVLYTVEFEQ